MYLETERLMIRYFQENDGSDLYDYLSKEKVVQYEPYKPFTYEMAMEEAQNRAANQDFHAVCLKTGKVIGNVWLSKEDFDTWEIGYVFNSDYWGNGYAYESARALLSHVFEHCNARRIVANCNPLNNGSWKLLERLGFRREGTLLKNVYFFKDEENNPIWLDTYEYGILKEEWR